MSDLLSFQAVVRPQKAEALFRRLHDIDGLLSCSAWEVRGTGNQQRQLGEGMLGFLPRVAIAGVIPRAAQPALDQLVAALCPTGRSGDGKVFYIAITQAAVPGLD